MRNSQEPLQGSDGNSQKSNRFVLKHIFFIFVGFLLAVLAINAVIFVAGIRTGFFHRWAEDQYFGRISEIRNGSFIILDQEAGGKTVVIRNYTRIRQGRRTVAEEALKIGTYVLVIGSINDERKIEAKVVRIFADD